MWDKFISAFLGVIEHLPAFFGIVLGVIFLIALVAALFWGVVTVCRIAELASDKACDVFERWSFQRFLIDYCQHHGLPPIRHEYQMQQVREAMALKRQADRADDQIPLAGKRPATTQGEEP